MWLSREMMMMMVMVVVVVVVVTMVVVMMTVMTVVMVMVMVMVMVVMVVVVTMVVVMMMVMTIMLSIVGHNTYPFIGSCYVPSTILRICYRLNYASSPPNPCVEVLLPAPQNGTLFGNRATG